MPARSLFPGATAALLAATLSGLALGQTPAAGAEYVEAWPDGTLKERCPLDEQGLEHGLKETFAQDGTRLLAANFSHGQRQGSWKEWDEAGRKVRFLNYQKDELHGRAEEFHPNGRIAAAGSWRQGLRTGQWTFDSADGQRRKSADYKDGLLHGAVKILVGDKAVTKQAWKFGELDKLDGMAPFPTPRLQLLRELRAILDQPDGPLDASDPIAAQRAEALRRLMAYRALCGVPWQGMSLVPEWNLRCDAASSVCKAHGKLDHTPPKPAGFDEERYKLGYDGASHSNLAINSSLPRSVDAYMDDSDASNIDRIGHRRWCLNPAMRKTGFGSDAGFHAMWSMDQSGGAPKGLDAVYYPPRGYTPVDLFSARRAFSVILVRGRTPKKEALRVVVRELDDEYLPTGEDLPLDHCDVAGGGYGGHPCLVFRPTGIRVEPGRRYLVRISYDGGKTDEHVYVVEFTDGAKEQG